MGLQVLLSRLVLQLGRNRKLFIAACIIISILSTVLLAVVEGFDNDFKDWVDYFSWITGTLTTTGFTAFPKTIWGRFIDAALKVPLFVLSLGLMGILLAWIIEISTRTNRGLGTFHGKGHSIIVGWNATTERLVKELGSAVVLIDPDLESAPDSVAFFVRGQPSDDDTLIRAGVDTCQRTIVFCANDGVTGLTAASVKRLNPKAAVMAVAQEVENVDRLEETAATVTCPVMEIARAIAAGARGKTVVFGDGASVNYLKVIMPGATFPNGDPAVDGDLVTAGVANYDTVVVAPRDDDHGWLAVSSVRAQAKQVNIITTLVKPENEDHLRRRGANEIFCPTLIKLS